MKGVDLRRQARRPDRPGSTGIQAAPAIAAQAAIWTVFSAHGELFGPARQLRPRRSAQAPISRRHFEEIRGHRAAVPAQRCHFHFEVRKWARSWMSMIDWSAGRLYERPWETGGLAAFEAVFRIFSREARTPTPPPPLSSRARSGRSWHDHAQGTDYLSDIDHPLLAARRPPVDTEYFPRLHRGEHVDLSGLRAEPITAASPGTES